jgi:hypothetical protein
VRKITLYIVLAFLANSCSKKDSLPDYAFVIPLYLKWNINGIEYEYRVGENAMFSRSFVLINSDGNRKFVYELHLDGNEFFRITFFSKKNTERPEKDLVHLLNSSEGLPFKTSSGNHPGSVLIEMFASEQLTKSTEIALNEDKKLLTISLRDFTVSEKKYIEAEIRFSCFLISVNDSSLAEITNGEGLIAFRYK